MLAYNHGKYWPITYDKTVKKKLITFMFYVKDNPDRQFEHKFITTEEERVFTKIINDYNGLRVLTLKINNYKTFTFFTFKRIVNYGEYEII